MLERIKQTKAVRAGIGACVCGLIAFSYYFVPLFFAYNVLSFAIYQSYRNLFWIVTWLILACLPIFESRSLRTCWLLRCTQDYFQFEHICSEPRENYSKHQKKFLILTFPHGVISMGGLAAASSDPEVYGPTAVANIVFHTPILRHFFGIFGIVKSDRRSCLAALKENHLLIYPGGIAELFLSDQDREEIYFERRRGCISLAMEAGADILPCYVFGNTQMYHHLKGGSTLSRLIRGSVTLFWGRWGSPIPFQTKVLFAVGNIVKVPDRRDQTPKADEIAQAHTHVKEEVSRLFNAYKGRLPAYKDKTLIIQ